MEEELNNISLKQLDDVGARERANSMSIFYKSWGKDILEEELNNQKDIMAEAAWDEQEFYVVKGRIKELKALIRLFESESLLAITKPDEE